MEITICPGKAPGGAAVPLSKSEAGTGPLFWRRWPRGKPFLPRLPASGDLLATMDCLRQMGTSFTERENSLLVTPDCGPPAAPPPAGLPGKRQHPALLLPVAAALGLRAIFTGRGRLPQRPVEVLLAALQRNGITAEGAAAPLGDRACRAADPRRFSPAGECQLPVCFRTDAGAAPLTGPSEIRLTGALESAGYAG